MVADHASGSDMFGSDEISPEMLQTHGTLVSLLLQLYRNADQDAESGPLVRDPYDSLRVASRAGTEPIGAVIGKT